MNRWVDKIGREEHSTQGGILVLQHGLQILDTPGENHQARMLLNVFFLEILKHPIIQKLTLSLAFWNLIPSTMLIKRRLNTEG